MLSARSDRTASLAPPTFPDASAKEVSEVLQLLQSHPQTGLSEAEAAGRLLTYGPNEIETKRITPLWMLVLRQFASPLVWVLLAAGILAFLFQEWMEGYAILFVLALNAAIGAWMERQAQTSMEALRQLAQVQVRVQREGSSHTVPSAHLVPGDILFLESGDVVAADCRILESANLGAQEAALTGESTLVSKRPEKLETGLPPSGKKNMVFKGTTISRGHGLAVVVGTGKHTELGKVATLTREAEKETTPLEKKLGKLSQRLLVLTLLVALALFLIGILEGQNWYDLIKTAIALAIAAIPEGLPIVATIALAHGMLRLAQQQVIVKKLSAVQTLGETQVIFTDKTGTLTENRLSVESIILLGPQGLQTLPAASAAEAEALQRMLQVAVLCNNARLASAKEGFEGDPLETALLEWAQHRGADLPALRDAYPRERELPFDSDSKFMGTCHRTPQGGQFLFAIKGAPEILLQEADFALGPEGPVALDRDAWLHRITELAGQGLRLLALADSHEDQPSDRFLDNLTFLGLVAFLDPPRPTIAPALQECAEAGIQVVMVTGDYAATAHTIAEKVGMETHLPPRTGKDLEGFEDWEESRQRTLLDTRIYARVTPEQKLRLVTLFQRYGRIVGMTGDGINDAPALRKADIGIAMGLRGTEAAKEAADLVLKDDAFPSIVLAIRQGRGIFENIRHFVVYLLSCNLSEVLVISVTALTAFGAPLLPLQILFINMVTDIFPALALGMNHEAPDIMDRPPRPAQEPILTRAHWRNLSLYASCMTLATLGAMLWGSQQWDLEGMELNNLAFYTLIFAQLFHVFNLPRPSVSFWKNEVTTNPYVWTAIGLSAGLVILLPFVPFTREVLHLDTLPAFYLLVAAAFGALPIPIIQLIQRVGNPGRKKKENAISD